MKTGSLTSGMVYAWDLVGAGIQGAGSALKTKGDRSPARSIARSCLAPALIGAAMGAFFGRKKRTSGFRMAMAGAVGTAIGAGGGVAWATRSITGAAARQAASNINTLRDARWLEKNPIAYA